MQEGGGSDPAALFRGKQSKEPKALRTRLSICRKKARYASEAEALEVVFAADYPLRPYRCDRCGKFHLTSRTRGKRIPRPLNRS